MPLANVTLELSLKPFKDDDFDAVCAVLFRQWLPLIERAEQVSVLLWVADGSELLDYRGDFEAELEWARYIGGATPRQPLAGDPDGVGLHSRCYDYLPDPPRRTYRHLAEIIAALKRVGAEVTGRPVRVGETFDPGPEFARSPFKYERHEEICLAQTMGRASFACCYGVLQADDPEAFAAAILRLHDDAALWRTLSARGLDRVAALYSPHAAEAVWRGMLHGFGLAAR